MRNTWYNLYEIILNCMISAKGNLGSKKCEWRKNLEILNIPFPKDLLGKFEDCIKQYKNSTNIISTKIWIYNFSINIFNSRLWLFLWPSLKINFNYPNPHNYCGPTSFIANFAQVYFQVYLPTTMKTGHQVPEQKTRRILVTCASIISLCSCKNII